MWGSVGWGSGIGPGDGGPAYLIPESGTVLTHVNATDLNGGTAKVGGAWTKTGSPTFNSGDSPRPSVGGFSAANYFQQATSPSVPTATPFTGVALVKMTAIVSARISAYSCPFWTSGSAANLGGLLVLLGYPADPTFYNEEWSGAGTESFTSVADSSVAGFNVVMFGNDGTNLFSAINSAAPTTVANSGYAAGTVTTAFLGNDPTLASPLQGSMYEFMMCTAVPSAAAFTAIYNHIIANQ